MGECRQRDVVREDVVREGVMRLGPLTTTSIGSFPRPNWLADTERNRVTFRLEGEAGVNTRPRSVRVAGAGPAVPGFVLCLPTPRRRDLEGQLTRQQAEARLL